MKVLRVDRYMRAAVVVLFGAAAVTSAISPANAGESCSGLPVVVPGAARSNALLSGSATQAIVLASSRWNRDLGRHGYKMEDQSVAVRQLRASLFEVAFYPKRLKKSEVGGETPFGRDVVYLVDVRKREITCHLYQM